MHRRHPLLREALLCAAAAASIAALLAWLGPPGTDLAAHAYQRTLFLEHGFVLWNNFWYAGRYSFVTYSLLYYPLAAILGIRLLAVADDRARRARVLRRRLARMGADDALVEPELRRRLGRHRPLRGVPVRARDRVRAALDLGAAGERALALRCARRADARREPARVPAARRRPRGDRRCPARDDSRELAADRRRRGGRGDGGRALAAVPGGRPLPVLARGGCRRRRLLRARARVHVAPRERARAPLRLRDLPRRRHGCVPRPVGDRREHRAAPVRRDPARGARPLAAALEAARPGARRARARGVVEPDAARGELRQQPVRRDRRRRRLAGRDPVSPSAPRPRLPRRGRRHARPLAGRLSRRRRNPARARLVPAGRLPAEPGPVRQARRRAVPRVAARARRPLRRPLGRAARLQLARGGEARRQRPRRARAGARDAEPDDLPGAERDADPHRAGRSARRVAHGGADDALGDAGRALPGRRPLEPVLAGVVRLPERGEGRDAAARDASARRSCGSSSRSTRSGRWTS